MRIGLDLLRVRKSRLLSLGQISIRYTHFQGTSIPADMGN